MEYSLAMKRPTDLALTIQIRLGRLREEVRAQDLIEYALMAGFVATAAGAIMPAVATSISTIFSRVASVLSDSARFPNG